MGSARAMAKGKVGTPGDDGRGKVVKAMKKNHKTDMRFLHPRNVRSVKSSSLGPTFGNVTTGSANRLLTEISW